MYLCQNRPKGKQWNEKENGLKPFSSNGKHHPDLMVRPFGVSVRFSSFNYSDVMSVGAFPPYLIVNIHPASAHALDCDCLAIHPHLISVDSGDGHFGGSVSSPPFNQ